MSFLRREIRPLSAVLLVLLAIGVVFGLYLNAYLNYSPPGGSAAACLSNLKQLAVAFTIYASDFDETAMPAENWNDVLLPYFKQKDLLHCPNAKRDLGRKSFGYAYNEVLSRARLPREDKREGTILFFETSLLMPNAIGGAKVVDKPGRHSQKNGFAYLDGRARMIKDGDAPGSWNLNPTR